MFTTEKIIGHENEHWQVVFRPVAGPEQPWCETATADKAYVTAAALNRYQQSGAMMTDGEAEHLRAAADRREP